MSVVAIALIAVAIAITLAGIALIAVNRRRAALRQRFGPEYDHVVESAVSRRAANTELRERLGERRDLEIRPLPSPVRDQYVGEWERVQAEFVDAPRTALNQADALVTRVMRDRGYPVDDFEHQAALVSVDHAGLVDNYRRGHETYLSSVNGNVTTESMRQGFVCYRSLFAELLDDQNEDKEVSR